MMSLIVELERCKEVKDSDTRQSRLHACLRFSWRGCEDEAKDGGVEGYLQMMIFSMQHLTWSSKCEATQIKIFILEMNEMLLPGYRRDLSLSHTAKIISMCVCF